MSVAAETATLPEPGDVIDGKYRVDHRIGSGAMSVVYQVTHRVTHKRFAMKWLLPELASHSDLAERFLREARVGGRFEHPNAVEVYDVGASNGGYYMVLELLSGESLQQRLQRSGELSWPDTCRLLLPCMRAVAEAHGHGIVHRDLKPANIFVCAASKTAPECAKVLDFGLAKFARAPGEQSLLGTRSGVVMGTPHYMPLEQMRGEAVDRRVDVYAFGVTLYQALSGRLPYRAATFGDLVLAMASESPSPLERWVPGLPDGVGAAIGRALARQPADRYADLHAFLEALTPFVPSRAGVEAERRAPIELEPETGSTPQPRAARFASNWTRLEPNRSWIAPLALLAAASLASVALLRHGGERSAPRAVHATPMSNAACEGPQPCAPRRRDAAHVSTQPIEHPPRAPAPQLGKWIPAAAPPPQPQPQPQPQPKPQPSWKVRRQWRQARAYVANAPPPEPRAEEPRPSASNAGTPAHSKPAPAIVARPPHPPTQTPHTPASSHPVRLLPLHTDDF